MVSMSPQERFAAQLAAAGITPEKQLYAVVWAAHEAALAARDAAKTAQEAATCAVDAKAIVDEVGRSVRSSLCGLQPEFDRRWRWQRWMQQIALTAAGLAALAAGSVGLWEASAAVATRQATAEAASQMQQAKAAAAAWQSWCSTPDHVITAGGKPICQVPLNRGT